MADCAPALTHHRPFRRWIRAGPRRLSAAEPGCCTALPGVGCTPGAAAPGPDHWLPAGGTKPSATACRGVGERASGRIFQAVPAVLGAAAALAEALGLTAPTTRAEVGRLLQIADLVC